MKPLVVRSAITASLGGLIFGYDTAVISGTTEALTKEYHLTPAGLGWTVAIALVGTVIGALVAGRPADKYGRKPLLFAIGILYVVGALGSAFAGPHWMLLIARFLGGLGVGAASVCAPIYTSEIAPAKHRGRLVGLVQLNVVVGILLAYLANYVINLVAPADVAWRWMLGFMLIPSLAFITMLLTVPETPRWLIAHQQRERGEELIGQLTGSQEEATTEKLNIQKVLEAERNGVKAPFFVRQNRKVILLAVAIAFFNQLSGINAVLYYAPEVMKQAGASNDAAFLMSVAVGAMNLVATVAALTIIDKFGRKRLMLVGSIGYIVSLFALATVMFVYEPNFTSTSSILVLCFLMLFIAAHAFGQGAVIWVFISEIFPNRLRGPGMALGSLTHWVFAAVTTYLFPPVIAALGGGVAFAGFGIFMILQLIWVVRVMPETKGVPLEEMEKKLGVSMVPEDEELVSQAES